MKRLESFSNAVVQSDMTAASGVDKERLLINGIIYQPDSKHATWLHIVGETIQAVGSGAPPAVDDEVQVVDLKGKFVMPGLHDSHIHCAGLGSASLNVNMRGCDSIAELKSRLAAHAAAHPTFPWVIGVQWAQHEMGGVYPTAKDLDDAMGDDPRPVWLWRSCFHIGVANSKALEIAGLGPSAPVPTVFEGGGGVVDVDADGSPTGVLRERATRLITAHANGLKESSATGDETRRMFFEVGVQQCLANGLTSLQSNDGGMGAWEHYSAMEEAGTLPLRIFLTVNIDDITPGGNDSGGGIGGLGGGAVKAPPAGSMTAGGLVKCERVKLFGDGSLGAETAAIRGAYNSADGQEQLATAPEEGVLIQPDDELAAKMAEAKRQGYRLEIHAIGDRAAASVLDGLERAGVVPQDRAVITHCQLLGADLIERMAKLKCIANIQPQFVVTDAPFARARIPARIQEHAYVWKSLLEKGIPCAGGSDAPVEAPTPLIGMHNAIFRYGVGADPATAYKPEQALSFDEALALYTQGGAYAAGEEERLGQITPGFAADLTIVDVDVSVDPALLATAQVEQVWVAGIPRFDRRHAKGMLPPAVQLGGPYIPGKNGPIPEPYVWPSLQARIPHRMACGGGALDDPGCGCGDEDRCGRVPFADTFLVGATLGQFHSGRIGPPRGD